MKLRALVTLGLTGLLLLFWVPLSGSADAYPVTTCSTLAVSTTNPVPGEAITVTGSNFTPHAQVTLVLRPGGALMGTATADGDGAFTLTAPLPDSTTNQGHFDIVATTGALNGNSCSVDPFQNLAVQAAAGHRGDAGSGAGGGGGLAFTGLDIAALLALAAVLLGSGVLLSRTRSTRTASGRPQARR